MAIQVGIETSRFGIAFQNVYFRVVQATVYRVTENPYKYEVMIDVAGYASFPIDANTVEVDFKRYRMNYDDVAAMQGENIFEKCYAWVLAQPEMQNAIQV